MIDESTAQRVLRDFGFTESLEWVRPLSRGTKGVSARVRVNGGDWVMKSFLPSQVERTSFARTVEMRLAEVGFPVATVRSSLAGSALVEHEGTHYSLHGWVDGRHASIAERDHVIAHRPGFLREMATALATVHQIARSMEQPVEALPAATLEQRLLAPSRADRGLHRLRPPRLSQWHVLRLRPTKSEFDRWIVRVLPRIRREAHNLSQLALASPLHESPIIVVHNDLNWENLVLDEDFGLRALLDFDNVTRAPLALEVGAAAVVLAGTDRDRVEEFVTAYQGVGQVRVDREAVELAMRLKCAQSLTHSIATHLADRSADTTLLEAWCRHLYASLEALTEQ